MADAKIDAFLSLMMDGSPVSGESSDENFKDTIELLDCDLKFTSETGQKRVVAPQSTQGSGGPGIGAPTPSASGESSYERKVFELSIKKHVDICSTTLYKLFCKRNILPLPDLGASVFVRKSGGGPRLFYVVTLEGMTVSEYNLKWESTYFMEDVTFKAKTCIIWYYPQLADGTMSTAKQTAEWTFFDTGGAGGKK